MQARDARSATKLEVTIEPRLVARDKRLDISHPQSCARPECSDSLLALALNAPDNVAYWFAHASRTTPISYILLP